MSEHERYDRLIDSLKAKAAQILPKGSVMSLYGSRARGDAGPDSDWDIHVLIPGPEKIDCRLEEEIAWSLDSEGLKFGEFVNSRVYSFAGWLKRSFLPFYKNVEVEKVIIYES